MTGFGLRLAVGSGRAAVVRLILVIVGTAFAAALLLTATGVATLHRADLAISGSGATVTYPDGSTRTFSDPGSSGPITSSYLTEPGLRHGVVIGFVLCVVPLLVFIGTASRVAARRRDERLAGLRLAGATQHQVRLLAAVDTAFGTALGSVLGVTLFLVARVLVLQIAHGQVRDIAVAVLPPLFAAVAVLLLLILGATLAAAASLRAVLITPLGVVRRAPRRHPRPWGLLLLLIGLACFAGAAVHGVANNVEGDAMLGGSLGVALLGLVTCGPWLTSLTGRLAARAARGPALLLAGRRLEDEPRAQARAMSAVVLVVTAATIALVILRDFQRNNAGPGSDDFYVRGFALAAAGMVFSLLVAAGGLLLTTLEGLLERKRTLAALRAAGVPVGTLNRAVLLQVGLPVLPAATLAVFAGLGALAALTRGQWPGTPWTLVLLPPGAALACVAAAACTLPALRRAADLEQLRVP
ncbi:MAG: hypothetical protein QOI82_776 [Actinomycetota bacterium]|jgi:hypothetical protein|nr:hypothetical protein [Actinomycetota bacterium]